MKLHTCVCAGVDLEHPSNAVEFLFPMREITFCSSKVYCIMEGSLLRWQLLAMCTVPSVLVLTILSVVYPWARL